ncbi:MurR/RpiR family transcriptional regulator [uncultured Kocuria sp.]|uniref:MurR/RpiR family transcriptional regulator n=1 Tax=uncultured Kocuria sp. TaxID=259305 RepID=UPI002595C23F|nr:MurR/RpiR family transcriptional regulator [uncultured Kocuria sp.]
MVSHRNVRSLVHEFMEDMSPSERKAARAVLAGYPSSALGTVAELAAVADVSPPTVIRFAARLGYSGWPELQRDVVKGLNDEGSPLSQYPHKTGAAHEDGRDVLTRSRRTFVDMIESTYESLPESEFRAMVHELCDRKKQIMLVGGRFSGFLAEYLAAHLRLLRPGISMVGHDELSRATAVADANRQTVLVVFDYRRYTAWAEHLAQTIQTQGATVCLMTDVWLSPIARTSSVVLPCPVESPSPFDSITAATAVVESLIAAVTEQLGEHGKRRVALAEGILRDA